MKIIHLSSPQTQNQNQDLERKLIVVFGGFDDWELDATKKRITDTTWENDVPAPDKLFTKGDHFRGILFGKFASEVDRGRVVEKNKVLQKSVYGKTVWAKNDMPINERVIRSVLFGTKHIVDKTCLWVDEKVGAVSLNK